MEVSQSRSANHLESGALDIEEGAREARPVAVEIRVRRSTYCIAKIYRAG